MKKNEFVEYVKDVLSPFATITVRAMFGGYGVYTDKMIGLIADNELYLKADMEAVVYFKACGSEPFTYQGKNKPVAMSYWKVLPEIMDEPEDLKKWFDLAVKSALKPQQSKKSITPRE